MDAATIIEEVNQLSPEDRLRVIDALLTPRGDQQLTSLEASHVALVEARHRDYLAGEVVMEDAWESLERAHTALAEQRLEALKSGQEKSIPFDEVMADLRKKYR